MASSRALQPIQAGDLRMVGTIERPVGGVDATGTALPDFVTFADNVPMAIAQYRGGETFQANQLASQITTYITIRWRPGIVPNMRVKVASDASQSPALADYYDIQSVVSDASQRRGLLLQCIKRDSSGWRTGETNAT